ncbi:hypothetical protein G7Y89_g2094 [Cudoniella acicularis]|uniref:Uncharacterized protein n=1 Tax=Cudoniella acicularis TaxID=354080 RepID=A0A8H4RU33_9HELO|nr:hypothetical protein G7Y89_g2094 [Cudoniella acicularis]
MPKPKQFLKEAKKKSKHAPQVPTSADEFLAVGVDFEEAGEKWRGGDAAKSTRFFVRAIECYDEGLRKFPMSFDLAYNKARIQYELTQHPKLRKQLPGNLLDLLQVALDSSRYALKLKEDDADVLFNTGQILTSLVDALNESNMVPDSIGQSDLVQTSYQLLQEALELFARCLSLQEAQYKEFQVQLASAADSESSISNSGSTATRSETPMTEDLEMCDGNLQMGDGNRTEEERWAAVVLPVSKEVLLDTILAQLETATALLSLITDVQQYTMLNNFSQATLAKVTLYLAETSNQMEINLARAVYNSAAADAGYRNRFPNADSIVSYFTRIEDIWRTVAMGPPPPSAEGLSKRAEAYITASNLIRLGPEGSTKQAGNSRWALLTWALADLKAATNFRDDENIANIYTTMGDVELWRFQMGMPPTSLPNAVKSKATLVKNAETYYRGAKKLTANRDLEQHAEASTKESLAMVLAGSLDALPTGRSLPVTALQIMSDAVEEGLVQWDQIPGHAGIGV